MELCKSISYRISLTVEAHLNIGLNSNIRRKCTILTGLENLSVIWNNNGCNSSVISSSSKYNDNNSIAPIFTLCFTPCNF